MSPVLLIHHAANRGHDYPPNSLQSLRFCLEAGARAIEVDVTPLADGDFALLHEARLEEATTGEGDVHQQRADQVRRLHYTWHSTASGEPVGTWVEPRPSGLTSRKLWIAFGLPVRGRVAVDDGAVRALTDHGRSLLPVGVRAVEGSFVAGDAIDVVALDGRVVAKGRAAMDHTAVAASAGRHSAEAGGEVVHRDDLVVFAE